MSNQNHYIQEFIDDIENDKDVRYHQFVQNLPAAIYTCDAQGYITLYNKAAVDLWGRAPEIGKDLWCGSWRIYHTDGRPLPLDQCPMAIALKQGRTIRGEEIVVERPDGLRRHVLVHPQPVFDKSGAVIEAFNMLVDITEHKQAERALRESEDRFKIVADTAPVMIWMAGTDKEYNFLNTGWLKFTGNSMEQEMGDGWMEGIHPDDLDSCLKTYTTHFDARQNFNLEYRLKRHDGMYRWLSCSAVPRFASDGSFVGYIGSCIDIEDKKLIAEALEKEVERKTKDLKLANSELERSNKELEQFAYAASHDMQEPLRKIQTFIGFLMENQEQDLSTTNKVYLSKIQNSAKRMSEIINGLLHYSQSTSQNTQYSKTNLNAIIENVKADLELLIQQKNASVICDKLPEIWAVPTQINQLFFNLINNSLKFSKPDTPPVITISLEEVPASQINNLRGSFIEIKVSDNGIGFESKYAEKIFNLFQRLNDRYSYSGNGIGLALCKKIVENHHGFIKAKSEAGDGATFYIKLPASLVVS
jgi:PAS domain S-box-containing protein